jgi:hypothetical protein
LALSSGSSLSIIRAIHLWAKSGVTHSSSVAVGNFEILCNFVPVNLIQDMKVQPADLYYAKQNRTYELQIKLFDHRIEKPGSCAFRVQYFCPLNHGEILRVNLNFTSFFRSWSSGSD